QSLIASGYPTPPEQSPSLLLLPAPAPTFLNNHLAALARPPIDFYPFSPHESSLLQPPTTAAFLPRQQYPTNSRYTLYTHSTTSSGSEFPSDPTNDISRSDLAACLLLSRASAASTLPQRTPSVVQSLLSAALRSSAWANIPRPIRPPLILVLDDCNSCCIPPPAQLLLFLLQYFVTFGFATYSNVEFQRVILEDLDLVSDQTRISKMAGDQGAGGGIESNRRHMSTSTRNGENEPIQESEPQTGKQTQQEEAKPQFKQSSQVSPRGFNPPSNTSTPTTAPLMARASSNSSTVSTPNVPTDSYFGTVPEVKASAPRISRPIEPPVTKVTLSELDVCKIMHNPKLRHDINFDPELHFRPNLDGDKGKRKQHKADLFWNTLQEQLIQFVSEPESFFSAHGQDDDWCLPSLLKAVKEIIQTLVPQRDRVYLDEGLNVDLLMQQFYRGIADLEKLALWLSRVLKSHCAPMRDEWVDQMYTQLSNGNRTNNVDELVKGMKSLLSVLEAMKLDVANHQIRCLRPILIEGTIPFERKFFEKKIQGSKLDVTQANAWYRDAEQRYAASVSPIAAHSFGEMSVFFEAISRLVLPSVSEKALPNTFIFEEERFGKLRADMLDAINLEVCMRMYDDLERVGRLNAPLFASSFSQFDDEPRSRPLSMTPDFNFNTPPSRPSSLAFSSGDSATSSPRSSLILPPQPTSDPTESLAKARDVYNSLVALLHTSPPPRRHESRWEAIAPSLALQIFRFTNAPADMLPVFESKLASHVCDINSPLFQEVEAHFHHRLLMELQKRVREFRGLTGVGLFTVATGGRAQGSGRSIGSPDREGSVSDSNRENRDDGGIEDMATRLAHLGILHWRVFAGLAYTEEEQADSLMEMNQF
ncbi:T-complex protein 11, partial [Colletotrichum filicis]